MRTFTEDFLESLQSIRASKPVWIARFIVNGTHYLVSDQHLEIFDFGTGEYWYEGITKNWVKNWNSLKEGLNGVLGEFHITDFNIELLISNEAVNAETMVLDGIDSAVVQLYQWSAESDFPPMMVFKGFVRDVPAMTDLQVTLAIQDESLKLERNFIGTKIDQTTFAKADPDDIGKILPIPFGTVKGLPVPCVVAGYVSSIATDLDANATTVTLTDVTGLYTNIYVYIDSEIVQIGGWNATTKLATITRAQLSTVATPHAKGTVIYEKVKKPLVFLMEEPVTSIDRVYGLYNNVKVDITSVVSRYTGQSGSIMADYPTRSGVMIYDLLAVQKLVALSLAEQTHNHNASSGISENTNSALPMSPTFGGSGYVTSWLGLSVGNPHTADFYYSTILAFPNTAPGSRISTNWSVTITPTANGPACILIGLSASAGSGGYTYWHNHTATLVIGTPITVTFTTYGGGHNYLMVAMPGSWWTIQAGGCSRVIQSSSIPSSYSGSGISSGAVTEQQETNTALPAATAPFGVWSNLGTAAGVSIGHTAPSGRFLTANFVSPPSGLRQSVTYEIVAMPTVTKTMDLFISIGVNVYWHSHTQACVAGKALDKIIVTVTLPTDITQNQVYLCANGETTDVLQLVSATRTLSLIGVVDTGISTGGNSVADTVVGTSLLVDVTAPNTDVDDVFNYLLAKGGRSDTITIAGAIPSGYAFNGAITEYNTAIYWLNYLALQTRSWFNVAYGIPRLVVRPTSLVSVHSLAACKVNADGSRKVTRKRSDFTEVLNVVNVLYNRDWSMNRSNTAYKGLSLSANSAVDATDSIALFGKQENPNMFQLDFVTSSTMADDLRDYYLTQYKDRRWIYTFEAFMEDSMVEFGDVVTLDFFGGVVGIVISAEHTPGDASKSDGVKLTVIT